MRVLTPAFEHCLNEDIDFATLAARLGHLALDDAEDFLKRRPRKSKSGQAAEDDAAAEPAEDPFLVEVLVPVVAIMAGTNRAAVLDADGKYLRVRPDNFVLVDHGVLCACLTAYEVDGDDYFVIGHGGRRARVQPADGTPVKVLI